MVTPTQPQQPSPDTGQTVRNNGGSTHADTQAAARELAEKAKAEGRARVESARGTAAETLGKLASSAKAAASELQNDDVGNLSRYVSDLAENMTRFADRLRNKSGDEMLHEVGRLARENPALFVTGSMAIGFGIARFARASRPLSSDDNAVDEHSQLSTASDNEPADFLRQASPTPSATGDTPQAGQGFGAGTIGGSSGGPGGGASGSVSGTSSSAGTGSGSTIGSGAGSGSTLGSGSGSLGSGTGLGGTAGSTPGSGTGSNYGLGGESDRQRPQDDDRGLGS